MQFNGLASQLSLLILESSLARRRHTVLENYLFRTGNGDMLLGLGAASLFNHSSSPSLDYRVDKANLIIRFFAARDIKVRGSTSCADTRGAFEVWMGMLQSC